MLVLGTKMHVVTLVFVMLEMLMFGSQLVYYLFKPEEKGRFWYLILLFLLIIYNITGGLFPDEHIDIPIFIQNIIAYGSGFLMASYFPFYFYKAFNLKLLRFHAIYGVPLFLLLPYLLFFVIVYSINRNLEFAIQYGILIPFFYSIILLSAILRAIRVAYKVNREKNYYVEEMAIYFAVAPWALLTLIVYFQFSQVVEAIFTNTGFIVITIMFIWQSIQRTRREQKLLLELSVSGPQREIFQANILRYRLTRAEILIVQMICKGMNNKEIANSMFISEETIKKHIQNTFKKTGAKNRTGLIYILKIQQ